MKTSSADIALLTDHRYTTSTADEDDWYLKNILRDDELLQNALEEHGITSIRVDWADPDIDWSDFKLTVFRTTWDYFERISEFKTWLKVVSTQTRLCNEPSFIWWNMDKHYLSDLEEKGIPIVPTRFIEAGSAFNLKNLLDEAGWYEAVVKPCVSGAARHTYRINKKNAATLQDTVQPLIAEESFLIQPFIRNIQTTGEDTLIIIDGRYTHAIRKLPKTGDFRVQDDHGGTVHPLQPEKEQIDLAERTMAACPSVPVYGRVDMVKDHEGRWLVMELELIEPELWLRESPAAAKHFAKALSRII